MAYFANGVRTVIKVTSVGLCSLLQFLFESPLAEEFVKIGRYADSC